MRESRKNYITNFISFFSTYKNQKEQNKAEERAGWGKYKNAGNCLNEIRTLSPDNLSYNVKWIYKCNFRIPVSNPDKVIIKGKYAIRQMTGKCFQKESENGSQKWL